MDLEDLLLEMALKEDLGHGDVTTDSIVDSKAIGKAQVVAREWFVLSGSEPFSKIFKLLDPDISIEPFFSDGDEIFPGEVVFSVVGKVCSILKGERTALNFLQRLSGIATLTRRMVRKIDKASCKLLDTRKTTPLWRSYEKQAVRHGGGYNHRFGLSDGILIKDNHIAAAGGVREAIRRVRENISHMLKIEVEVDNLGQLEEAIDAGADIILLDNFSLEDLHKAVEITRGRALLEASGGISLDSVKAVAETGVDFISCGALTHSSKAVDISLELVVE